MRSQQAAKPSEFEPFFFEEETVVHALGDDFDDGPTVVDPTLVDKVLRAHAPPHAENPSIFFDLGFYDSYEAEQQVPGTPSVWPEASVDFGDRTDSDETWVPEDEGLPMSLIVLLAGVSTALFWTVFLLVSG